MIKRVLDHEPAILWSDTSAGGRTRHHAFSNGPAAGTSREVDHRLLGVRAFIRCTRNSRHGRGEKCRKRSWVRKEPRLNLLYCQAAIHVLGWVGQVLVQEVAGASSRRSGIEIREHEPRLKPRGSVVARQSLEQSPLASCYVAYAEFKPDVVEHRDRDGLVDVSFDGSSDNRRQALRSGREQSELR